MKTTFIYSFLVLFLNIPNFSNAQLVTVSGYVTNYITGTAIENVTVFESRSGIGTISNNEGFYKLRLISGHINLTFSDSGYKTFSKQLTLNADTTLTVRLKSDKSIKNRNKKEVELQAASIIEKKEIGVKRQFTGL